MYVFEYPEPNGEVEQDLMMELDYRTFHENVEMCVCVCKCVFVCLSTYCYLCKLDHFHVCTCYVILQYIHMGKLYYSFMHNEK